jgi:hypothetical protein
VTRSGAIGRSGVCSRAPARVCQGSCAASPANLSQIMSVKKAGRESTGNSARQVCTRRHPICRGGNEKVHAGSFERESRLVLRAEASIYGVAMAICPQRDIVNVEGQQAPTEPKEAGHPIGERRLRMVVARVLSEAWLYLDCQKETALRQQGAVRLAPLRTRTREELND